VKGASKRRKIVLGDVFGLQAEDGEYGLHVVGKYEHTGSWVVRVVEPPLSATSAELAATLTHAGEKYLVIVTSLENSERNGTIRFLGNVEIPPQYAPGVFLFKANLAFLPGDSGRKDPRAWWLSDGVKSWRVGELESRYRWLPRTTVVPAEVLVDYINRGWNPDWEFDETATSEFASESRERKQSRLENRFFLIFRNFEEASAAAAESVTCFPWMTSEVVDVSDPPCVSLVLTCEAESMANVELGRIEDVLTSIAGRSYGTYDGNEIAV
jgi:hypothetical protein